MAETIEPAMEVALDPKGLSERIFEQRRRIRNRMQPSSLAKFPLPDDDQAELGTIDLLLIDLDKLCRASPQAEIDRLRSMWNAAIRLAAALVVPKPLKPDADGFDRLAHRTSELDAKGILGLIDHPELSADARRALHPEPPTVTAMAETEIPEDVLTLAYRLSLPWVEDNGRHQGVAYEAAVDAIMADRAVRAPDRDVLVEALHFYADPDTYVAIGFFPDRPCGEFMDDFDAQPEFGGGEVDRPGKRARAALSAIEAAK